MARAEWLRSLLRRIGIGFLAGIVTTLLYMALPTAYPLYMLPPILGGGIVGYLSRDELDWILAAPLSGVTPFLWLALLYDSLGLSVGRLLSTGLVLYLPLIISLISSVAAANVIYVSRHIFMGGSDEEGGPAEGAVAEEG